MRITLSTVRIARVLFAAAVLATPAICASAQSDSDLRRQNQQLTAQVDDLKKQLKEAQDRNRQLQDRVSQLESQLRRMAAGGAATPGGTTPEEPEKVTVDETVPSASPRALFKAIVDSYAKTTTDLDMGHPGDGKRRAYLKKLEGWKSQQDRELRGPITWHVRAVDSRTTRSGDLIVTLVAVDPETDVRLGNSFDVELSKLQAERLAWADAHGAPGPLVLRGTLVPNVRINEDRGTRGTFDNPPFIGPFAEFLYSVEVKSLTLAKEEKEPGATTKPVEPKDTKPQPPR